jgi:3-phenylpropionate/trans-cinnamate dioxygenase ferredoxin reductase subunit
MTLDRIVVVGASLAGMTAAETLRSEGFDGSITLVDLSAQLPSDRPPLSKQVLAGTMEPSAATLPQASRLDDLGLDVRLGVGAAALDASTMTVTLDDGSTLTGDAVIISVGASPRRLPTGLAGVHVLRTLDDCLAIRSDLDSFDGPVVVIGAGFIGSEVAATVRELGREVTIVEAEARAMQRVLPGPIGDLITSVHGDHGVSVRLGAMVDELIGDGRVSAVRLADGEELEASTVVVGIGVVPSTDWLEGSGLEIDNGIVCDEFCSAAPGIFAAGDVARWPNGRYDGDMMRVEQWENAIEQGSYVARRIIGGDDVEPFAPVPWFWSDQYDRKLQLAGRVGPDDEMVIVDGSLQERRFVSVFRRGDQVGAVLGMNRPAPVMRVRMAMSRPEGLPWDDALAQFASK